MITRAKARFVRVSPRKTRQVIKLIKGRNVVEALALLDVIEKKPALYIKRILKSAVSDAEKKSRLKPGELFISKILADGGPIWKRYRAASMGRATMIRRRTCHITVELDKTSK